VPAATLEIDQNKKDVDIRPGWHFTVTDDEGSDATNPGGTASAPKYFNEYYAEDRFRAHASTLSIACKR
jgi:hypothetical protein